MSKPSNNRSIGCAIINSVCVALLGCGSLAAGELTFELRAKCDEHAPLANPHKGWYHHFPDNHIDKYKIANDDDLLKFPGMDHLYLRLSWAYLEPREGQFDWPVIDRLIDKWTAQGLGIAFRISCKETSTDRIEQQYATPRWVLEAGAQGGYYRAGQPTGPDGPWEPRYDDPVFLQKLENFLRAFAARYDGKPWLRYVDIGSVGDWGEGHTSSGSRTECGFATRKKHVDLHLKYFQRTLLVASDDFVFAVCDLAQRQALHRHIIASGISYRDDSILVNGYLKGLSDRCTVRSPEFFADAYLKTPTVFELEHYGMVKNHGNWDARPDSSAAKYGKGKKGADYFRGALDLLHASYIGYHGYAHEWLADNRQLTGELLNRCGYWYFPQRVKVPAPLQAGSAATLVMEWENRGVAPAYRPYRLHLRWEGPEVFEQMLDANNQRWLPQAAQPCLERYRVTLPARLRPGTYMLKFKLYCPETKRDVLVALRSDLLDKSNYYRLGAVQVER